MTASEQPRGARGLGKFLVEAGVITDDERREAEYSREATGRRLAVVLVERNLVNGGRMAQTLSYHLSLPWVSLEHVSFSAQLLAMIPRELAEQYGVVPVHVRRAANGRTTLYVATDDPTSEEAVLACQKASGMAVRLMVSTPSDLQTAIAEEYGEPESLRATQHDVLLSDTTPDARAIVPQAAPPPRPVAVPPPRPAMASAPEHSPRPPLAAAPEHTPRPPMPSVSELAPRPPMPSVSERLPPPRPALASAPEVRANRAMGAPVPSEKRAVPPPRPGPGNGAPGLAANAAIDVVSPHAPAVTSLRSSPPPPPVSRAKSNPIAVLDDEVELDDEVAPTVRRPMPSQRPEPSDEQGASDGDEDVVWDEPGDSDPPLGLAPPPPPPPTARNGDDTASMPPPPGALPPPPPPPRRRQVNSDVPSRSEPAAEGNDEEDLDGSDWMLRELDDSSPEAPVERSGARLVDEHAPATTKREGRDPGAAEAARRSNAGDAVVLLIGAQPALLARCELVAKRLNARVQTSALLSAESRLAECRPFALIVPEDVFGFDRYAFTRLGIEARIPVVVWTEDLDEQRAFELLLAARGRPEGK